MRASGVFKGCLVGLAGAVAVAACSGKEAPAKGQIMVVLQSDMAIPKDFNRVRVDISVRGQKVFSDTYVADVSGSLVLPGTIAVVAGEEEAPPVEVKVVGISTSNEAQTFSKVITTMPRLRIATLRVPMQWLCTGQALQLGEGVDAEYESKCQPDGVERSCVAGECVDVHVAEADLPTYSPEEVFGGGTYAGDPSGSCFDVQACFKLGVDLAPDLDPESPTYCQAAIGVPRNFDVNFAVKTPPGGAGVCDDDDEDAPCYVVLDQSETFGWTPLDSAGPVPMTGGNDEGGSGGREGGSGGSGPAGTGGSAPSGGGAAGAAGAASGGAASGGSGPGPGKDNAGFVTSGEWHGNVFLAGSPAQTSIELTPPGTAFPLCVTGVVAATPDSSGYASVGFNLNQAMGMGAESTLPQSKLGGLQMNLTSEQTTSFRLTLSGPDALTVPQNSWCVEVGAVEQILPWPNFKNDCWLGMDTGGYDADLDDLTSVSVVVPGSTEPTPFSFCVHELSEQGIPQRVAPGQKTKSLPLPPGVTPLQAGGDSGTVVVQFPRAVCDRLNSDPELRLRGTAACDEKTEATPICGPWSSVRAPQVPNPDGVLSGGLTPGAGGAGGVDGTGGTGGEPQSDAGGDGGMFSKGGEGGSGTVVPPAVCEAPGVHPNTSNVIASFDSYEADPLIDSLDERSGYAFSVGYGVCEAGLLGKLPPNSGALESFSALRVAVPACPSELDNSVGVFIPFNSSAFPGFNGPEVPLPELVCSYDALPYSGVSFYGKASTGTAVSFSFVIAEKLSVDDPIPGGSCEDGCEVVTQTTDFGVGWLGYAFAFAQFDVDPSRVLGILLRPQNGDALQLDIDEVRFSGGP